MAQYKLGPGVRSLYKYTSAFSNGKEPNIFEEDIFTISIPLIGDESGARSIIEKVIKNSY